MRFCWAGEDPFGGVKVGAWTCTGCAAGCLVLLLLPMKAEEPPSLRSHEAETEAS